MLTVDKNELLKLQEDLYANPQKWTEIFTARDRTDWGRDRFHWATHPREDRDVQFADYQYWQTMASGDGAPDALINWPYYKEYMIYKNWFERTEDKALHTLKLAVAKLLADFDEANPEFDGKDRSKRSQLEHLMSLINEGTEVENDNIQAKKRKEGQRAKITSTRRDLD